MNDSETVSPDELLDQKIAEEPLRTARVLIDRKATRQVITGFGGNFAIARFGDRDAHDAVGGYVLQNMPIGHARIGIPLKTFIKASGDNYDAGHTSIKDVFRLMETLRDRKIALVASVWDVPDHCVTNPEATTDRQIAPDKRDKVIAAMAEWLRLGRERHGLTVPYVSFHHPEGGGLLSLSPEDMRYFITRGGAAFEKLGVPTKWILGDTGSGESLSPYVTTIMADKSVVPYLGPVAFHGWDSLSASDDTYRLVAKTARLYRKPVWCLETGYDPQLESSVWDSWDHALKLAQSYARCLTLAEASVMDYWQFQNDLPLINDSSVQENENKAELFPAFHILKLFAETFIADTQMLAAKVVGEGIYAVLGVESESAKLRLLLVNTGGAVAVDVSGGQPGASYLLDHLTKMQTEYRKQSDETPEMSLVALEGDKKGAVLVEMLPRSVAVVQEQ